MTVPSSNDDQLIALLITRMLLVVRHRMSPSLGNNRSVLTTSPVSVSLRSAERGGRSDAELQRLFEKIVEVGYTIDGFTVVGIQLGDIGQGAILVTFADSH